MKKNKNIKRSIITSGMTSLNHFRLSAEHNETYTPKLGDVAVFEVISLGKHQAIQAADNTLTKIFPGDYVLMAFGGRYASNQFEGYVPNKPTTELQILGQGGVVGLLTSAHQRFKKTGATKIRLVGYAVDDNNQVINTCYHNVDKVVFSGKVAESRPKNSSKNYDVYLSVGASMDSGKTTTAAYFARGAMLAGKRVAYIKMTGTVYNKDKRLVKDSGAEIAVDFSLCGYPSTYMCSTKEVLDIYATLLRHVESVNPDVVIVEIADGILQKETNDLLQNEAFMQDISGVILSCPDSLSAYGGLQILKAAGIEPMLLCGLFTASPLMIEEVRQFSPVAAFSLEDFLQEEQLSGVLALHSRPVKTDESIDDINEEYLAVCVA